MGKKGKRYGWIGGAVILFLLLSGCGQKKGEKYILGERGKASEVEFIVPLVEDSVEFIRFIRDTETEEKMRMLGLMDIQEVDPSIRVDLVYAKRNNFVGKILYRDIHKAFMLPETALRLADAQRRLKAVCPSLNLLIYDAARPMSVQQEMWEQVKGTDRCIYVSNPKNGGGLHNYGAAVDLTIVDSQGNPLPMGSLFDHFGEEARPDREEILARQGRISVPQLYHRRLLRRVMTEAGFRYLPTEWWHFNLMSREEARKTLKVIGF